jgi:xylose isomerase
VWDFAAGSMRTYLILKDKVERFNRDPEIQQLLGELRARGAAGTGPAAYGDARAKALKSEHFDLPALRARGYAYEHLDQLTTELLLGVR